MHLINHKPLDTAPLLCGDCGQLKRQFYVLGIKSLICVDCATGIARDFHADFDLIFNSDPQPVHAVKYGEFVRFTGKAKNPTVFERGEFCSKRGKYALVHNNRRTYVKPSTHVITVT